MKICTKCKGTKESSEFNKDKRAKDGLHSWCKKCHYAGQKEYHKEYQKEYQKTDKRRAYCNEYQKKYFKRYEARRKLLCRRETRKAIRKGILKRLPCEVCGVEKVVAHHEDYDKPLKVNWLCLKHHVELHNKTKES